MYGNVFTKAGTQIENYDFNALRRDKNGISALSRRSADLLSAQMKVGILN